MGPFLLFTLVAPATSESNTAHTGNLRGVVQETPFEPPIMLTTPTQLLDEFEKAFQGTINCGQKYQVSHHLFLRQIGNSSYLAGHPYNNQDLEPGAWNGEIAAGFVGADLIQTMLEEYCCGPEMTTNSGFSRCWCNYFAAVGEPQSVHVTPGNISGHPDEERFLVVMQGNPNGKGWEAPSDELPVANLIPATYENNLALMNQTFQVLFGPDFDTAKYCPSGVSVDVLNELRDYTQGCFQYKHGFPELYNRYAAEFKQIGLSRPKDVPMSVEKTYEMQKGCAGWGYSFGNDNVNATEFLQKLDDRIGLAPMPGNNLPANYPLCESTPWVRAYLFWAYGETALFLGDGVTPGSPEYIVVPVGNREQPIRLNEMPSHGIAIKSLHELMGLAADAPGPTAQCGFVFENRTFGWNITYGQ